MFLLEDAIANSVRFLLIVGIWVVGIASRLFKNIFFDIFPILMVSLLETGENGDRLLQIVGMLQMVADCLLISKCRRILLSNDAHRKDATQSFTDILY